MLHWFADLMNVTEEVTYVLDHLYEWQLVCYGLKIPRERLMWTEIYGYCLFFEMFQRFSSLALSPTQFTTFFLDGASYVFHLLIKSTLLAGKDLLCLDNKQNNTWSLVDSEFLFSCSTRRLTSKRSELNANSSDIELNIMGFLQVSKPWSSSSSYLNILSTDAFLLLLSLNFCFCFFLLSKFFFWQEFKVLFFHFPLSFSTIER